MKSVVLNRFFFISILLLLCWAPIPLGSDRQWAWTLLNFLVFALTACSLVSSQGHNTVSQGLLPNHIRILYWLGLAAFPITAALQAIFHFSLPSYTIDIGATLDALLRGLALLCFGFLIFRYVTTPRRLRILIFTIVIAALFQALYGTFLLFGDVESSPVFKVAVGDRATGSFVYQNHLANFLLISCAMGIGLLISQLQDKTSHSWKLQTAHWLKFILGPKMVLRLALIIIVGGLVLTKSRMGNSAFFISLMVTSLIALAAFKNKPKLLIWLIVSILAIDVLIIGSWVGMDKVKQRLEQTVLTEEGRLNVFEDGLPALAERPLTGQGAGGFYSAFNQFQHQDVGGFYDHAHNDYLQFAFEYGLVATSVAGICVLSLLVLNLITMRRRRSRLFQGVSFGCFMAILAMLIHCFVDFNLQAPANTFYFVSILTVTVIAHCMPRKGWQAHQSI